MSENRITAREFGGRVVDVVRDMSPTDVLSRVGVAAAAAGAFGWLTVDTSSLYPAVALGIALSGLLGSAIEIASFALNSLVEERPWYGVGRTVHHCDLGACEVVDFDDRDGLIEVWLLIRATEADPSAPMLWARAGEFEQIEATS
jgi:hypothetical protein